MKKIYLYKKAILIACFLMAFSVNAWSQDDKSWNTEVDVVGKTLDVSGNSAKLEEYGSQNGVFTNIKLIEAAGEDTGQHFFIFDASDVGASTQSYNLEGGAIGKYKVYMNFNGIEHKFTDDAKTVFSGAGSNRLTFKGDNNMTTQASAAPTNLFDIGIQRNQAGAGFKLDLINPFHLDLSFLQESTEGIKLSAIPLRSGWGSYFVDLPEPVDYRSNTLRAEISYTAKPIIAALSYSYSNFTNSNDYLYFQNPVSSATMNAAKSDYLSIAPSNRYGNLDLKGTWSDLPLNSVLNVKFNNAETASDVNLMNYNIYTGAATVTPVSLTSNLFNGRVTTTSYSAVLNSELTKDFALKTFYKWNARENKSDRIGQTETGVNGGAIFYNELFDYEKYSYGAEADIKLPYKLRLNPTYTHTNIDRKQSDFPDNSDHAYYVSLKWLGLSLGTPKLSYEIVKREADMNYRQTLFAADQAAANLIEPYVRRSDSAPMHRVTYTGSFDFEPFDVFTLEFYVKDKRTEYNDMKYLYGRRSNDAVEYGLDFNWDIAKALSLNGYYSYEKIESIQFQKNLSNSNQADPNLPSTSSNYTWFAKDSEKTENYGISLEYRAVPQKLTFTLGYDYTNSNGIIDYTFGYPSAYPADVDSLDVYKTKILSFKTNYNLNNSLSLIAGYAYQKFEYSDIAYDNYLYEIGSGTSWSSLSGAYATPSYEANTFYIGLSYKF